MPAALVRWSPTKTNLGLANELGEVQVRLSGDLGSAVLLLSDDLPTISKSTSGPTIVVVIYAVFLSIVRECVTASPALLERGVFEGFLDVGTLTRGLDAVARRVVKDASWRAGSTAKAEILDGQPRRRAASLHFSLARVVHWRA